MPAVSPWAELQAVKGRSRRVERFIGFRTVVYMTTAAERPLVSSITHILADVESPRSGRTFTNQKMA